jgi:hypothetical protein
MADVTPPPSRTGGDAGDGRDERAQLLLVAAFGLAVMFVALALILNTTIYTENLATRGSDIAGGKEAARYYDAAMDNAHTEFTFANYNNNSTYASSDWTGLDDHFQPAVEGFDDLSASLYSVRGRSVSVDVATTYGVRIVQDNASRTFTNESGVADWEVANDTLVRNFTMEIDSSVMSCSPPDCLTVRLDSTLGPDYWQVAIEQDGSGNYEVNVSGSGISGGTCAGGPFSDPTINFTAGTINGVDCPKLEFAEGLSGAPYHITIENGNVEAGTYEFVSTDTGWFELGANHHTSNTESPYATTALYSATVRIAFQTDRVLLVTVEVIAPGEPP